MSERVNNKIEHPTLTMFPEDVGLSNGNFELFFITSSTKAKYPLLTLLFKEINRADSKTVPVVFFESLSHDFDKLPVLFPVRSKSSSNMMNAKRPSFKPIFPA